MELCFLKNIKYGCVKSIFDIVAESHEITRLNISKKSGYSLVTVGKVIDALQDMGLLKQKIKTEGKVGRKASVISLNKDQLIQILDLSDNNFTFSVYNLNAEIIDAISFNYNENYFYNENLTFFLSDISKYVNRNYNYDNFIGIGVSHQMINFAKDELYSDIQSQRTNSLNNLVKTYLNAEIILAEPYIDSSSLYNIREIDNYKNLVILYCFINISRVNCILIINGKIIYGHSNSSELHGHLTAHNGSSLEKVIKSSNNPEKISWELCCTLNNLLRILCPHVLFIESNIYNNGLDMAELMKNCLINNFDYPPNDIPKIILKKHDIFNSHKGLVLKIGESWVENLIRKEKELHYN